MKTLSGITIYPVKSLAGMEVGEWEATLQGLKHDRKYMLADPQGNFISQRSHPGLASLRVKAMEGGFSISDPCSTIAPLQLPWVPEKDKDMMVNIWSDRVRAHHLSTEYDFWFSEVAKTPCKLVYMPDSTNRQVDGRYAPKGITTGFSDGFPYLIIGQSSLDDLNQRLQSPVKMNRFRPNLIFKEGGAFEEDEWKDFIIGDIHFKAVKPCSRCTIVTVEQESGIAGKEPLKTLASYRTKRNKVMFGMNVVAMNAGTISVGMPIELKIT